MQNAVWLASIFGPFMTILGLWMLLYSDNLIKIWSGIRNSPAIFYMGCLFHFLVGLVMLSQYDLWTGDGYVLVTLLGWALVLRGVLGLYAPQFMIKLMLSNNSFTKVMGIIPLVWGLALSWLAFFM